MRCISKQNTQIYFWIQLKSYQQRESDKDSNIEDLKCQIAFLELKGQEEK